MKLAMTATGTADLRRRAERALNASALDAALRAAAHEVRDGIAAADDEHDQDAIRVEPLNDGSGYAVVMDGAEPWLMEFGSRRQPPRPRVVEAVANAGPRLRRILSRLIGDAR